MNPVDKWLAGVKEFWTNKAATSFVDAAKEAAAQPSPFFLLGSSQGADHTWTTRTIVMTADRAAVAVDVDPPAKQPPMPTAIKFHTPEPPAPPAKPKRLRLLRLTDDE